MIRMKTSEVSQSKESQLPLFIYFRIACFQVRIVWLLTDFSDNLDFDDGLGKASPEFCY